MSAAAFCTAGKAYAGSTASFICNSKASTAAGTLLAAGIAASKWLHICQSSTIQYMFVTYTSALHMLYCHIDDQPHCAPVLQASAQSLGQDLQKKGLSSWYAPVHRTLYTRLTCSFRVSHLHSMQMVLACHMLQHELFNAPLKAKSQCNIVSDA